LTYFRVDEFAEAGKEDQEEAELNNAGLQNGEVAHVKSQLVDARADVLVGDD
jgi:hypothetical protein